MHLNLNISYTPSRGTHSDFFLVWLKLRLYIFFHPTRGPSADSSGSHLVLGQVLRAAHAVRLFLAHSHYQFQSHSHSQLILVPLLWPLPFPSRAVFSFKRLFNLNELCVSIKVLRLRYDLIRSSGICFVFRISGDHLCWGILF